MASSEDLIKKLIEKEREVMALKLDIVDAWARESGFFAKHPGSAFLPQFETLIARGEIYIPSISEP